MLNYERPHRKSKVPPTTFMWVMAGIFISLFIMGWIGFVYVAMHY